MPATTQRLKTIIGISLLLTSIIIGVDLGTSFLFDPSMNNLFTSNYTYKTNNAIIGVILTNTTTHFYIVRNQSTPTCIEVELHNNTTTLLKVNHVGRVSTILKYNYNSVIYFNKIKRVVRINGQFPIKADDEDLNKIRHLNAKALFLALFGFTTLLVGGHLIFSESKQERSLDGGKRNENNGEAGG